MDHDAEHGRLVSGAKLGARGRIITLETPDYILRTLESGDATDVWRDWLIDPQTARNLNARPEPMDEEPVRNYIASFNRTTTHLLGIFTKQTGGLIGIRAVHVDLALREFLVNVLIGETGARNKGARTQTSGVMYRYFFEDMGLETARCAAVADNAQILKVLDQGGWIRARTEKKTAASGDGFVQLHHFRLLRTVWRRKEEERATDRVRGKA